MTDSNRRILSQGDCDSACFFYAIANALIALTGQRVESTKWNEAVDSIIQPAAFLRARTGTASAPWDDDYHLLEPMARQFLGSISKQLLELQLIEGVDRRGIGKLISETSVLIVANPAHWFVVVETGTSKVYVACSARLNDVGSAYAEHWTPALRRPYNHCFPLSELRVFNRAVFRLTKKPNLSLQGTRRKRRAPEL